MDINSLQAAKPSTERLKAVIFLVMTAVLWSMGGMLIKLASCNSLAVAGARSAIAALMIMAYMRKPKIKWTPAFVGGTIAYAATVILFVTATKLTTAANAILLQYTAPVFVAVLGIWILKEKTSIKDWITVLIVLSGMVLFFIDDISKGGFAANKQAVAGNIIAILSGVAFAFLIIFMRMQKHEAPINSVFAGNILTAVIGLPFMIGDVPDAKGIFALVTLGVLQLGLSYILYSVAIKHVTAIEAAIIPVIEPILNPIWVLLTIGEMPGHWAIIGGLVVLTAITFHSLVSIFMSKSNAREAVDI